MKIALLFPGYGSQFVGMGKELYDNSRIMQEYFEEAANCLNMNLVKLCFASSDAEISKLENALVANFVISSSLAAILKEQGIKPDVVVGHDAGEYAALYTAGGMSFPDMLYLIQKYVSFYQDTLTAIPAKAIRITGLDEKIVGTVVKPYLGAQESAFISMVESPSEFVVAGFASSIDQLKEQLLQAGAKKVIDLSVVDGLHSLLMQPVEEGLRLYSEKVDFKDLQLPLMTGTDAILVSTNQAVKEALLRAITTQLRWIDCVKKIVDYDVIIQIGPGADIANKLHKMFPDKKIFSFNKEADLKRIKELVMQQEEKRDSEATE